MEDFFKAIVLIGLGGWITPYIKRYFSKIENKEKKIEISRLARNEFIAFRKHTELNLEKLTSLVDSNTVGDALDYQKLKYIVSGYRVIKTEDAFLLEDKLAQDVLRMELFTRNTELEIDSAINVIFNLGGISDEIKKSTLSRLIEREKRTVFYLGMIVKNLEIYSINPKKYNEAGVDWDLSDFKYKK